MRHKIYIICLVNFLLITLAVTSAFPQRTDPTFGDNGVDFTSLPASTYDRTFLYGFRGFPMPAGGINVLASVNTVHLKSPNMKGMLVAVYGDNGQGPAYGQVPEQNIYPIDAAQQPDGKIVAVGTNNNAWFVWRFNVNGALDTTFNSTGKRNIDFPDGTPAVTNVVPQPDGKILVSGISVNSSGTVTVVVRLNPDGTNDNTFGPYGNGMVVLFDGGFLRQKMMLRPDGKILLMGTTLSFKPPETTWAFFQLNSSGSPDTGFGDGGLLYAFEPLNNIFVDAEIQGDGKLVVLTGRDSPVEGTTGTVADSEAVLTRYNTDGSLDKAFGQSGKSVLNTSPPSIPGTLYDPTGSETPRGMVIDSTGKINVVLLSSQVAPARSSSAGVGYPGRLERKNVEYILQLDTSGKVVGSNFSRRSGYTDIVAAYENIDINGIFEQPGKGLVVYGSYIEYNYYNWPFRIEGSSIILSRFSSISAVNDANNFYDYNFDGRADFTTYHPENSGLSEWQIVRSQTQQSGSYGSALYNFGSAADTPAPGDYDGDGIQDLAVYRGSQGDWFTRKVYLDNCDPMNCTEQIHFGFPGDIAAPGDFDGDGKTDRAVFRPSDGNWYILFSTGGYTGLHFGQNGDQPVTGDYDGDGKSDVAVIRRENGLIIWYVLQSSNNQFVGLQFGLAADKAVPADYNGDGRTEVAVWRPSDGNWYLLSNYADFSAVRWGADGDLPAPADYDGDTKTDTAIFRPSEGTYYALASHDLTLLAYHYPGPATDIPVASVYVR